MVAVAIFADIKKALFMEKSSKIQGKYFLIRKPFLYD